MEDIRVFLAEDHLVTRQGIRRLLEDEKGIEVVGEAGDGQEAIDMVSEIKPDIVVMDVAMPRLNGIEATRQIKLMHPRIGILILSAYDDDEYVFALLKAGAAGYLLKSVSGDDLVQALKAIYKGEPVLDPMIAKKVMNYFQFQNLVKEPAGNSEQMSTRELEIIRLAAKGLTNREIAEKLNISIKTVENQMGAALKYLKKAFEN